MTGTVRKRGRMLCLPVCGCVDPETIEAPHSRSIDTESLGSGPGDEEFVSPLNRGVTFRGDVRGFGDDETVGSRYHDIASVATDDFKSCAGDWMSEFGDDCTWVADHEEQEEEEDEELPGGVWLHEHSTDPDYYERTGAPYPPMFQGFIKEHGRKKGPQMYEAMLQWRRAKDVNNILHKPHPTYTHFKQHAPDFVYGRTKTGAWVNYELTGRLEPGKLSKAGVKAADVEHHIAWSNEVLRRVIDRGQERPSMTVMDMGGFSVLKASSFFFLTLTQTYGEVVDKYYPGTTERTIVVNPPLGTATIFKIMMSVLPASFAEKTLFTSDLKDLHKYIDVDQIPVQYGGTNKTPLEDSEVELAIRAHWDKANRTAAVESPQ